jgi:hypothetical protein
MVPAGATNDEIIVGPGQRPYPDGEPSLEDELARERVVS